MEPAKRVVGVDCLLCSKWADQCLGGFASGSVVGVVGGVAVGIGVGEDVEGVIGGRFL